MNNGHPLISVTSIGYVPADSAVKHQFPPPLSIHPAPTGNGLVPPIIVIQIEPLSKAHAGVELQSGSVTTTLVTSSSRGSSIATTIGFVSQPLASSTV